MNTLIDTPQIACYEISYNPTEMASEPLFRIAVIVSQRLILEQGDQSLPTGSATPGDQ